MPKVHSVQLDCLCVAYGIFIMENQKEIWKDVKGYEGLYRVSNLGRVFSIRTNIFLSESKNMKGYSILAFTIKDKSYMQLVSRLVAKMFIENPENKSQVNHKDGIKSNNNAINLEWCTNSENMKHSYKTGLHISMKGENHPCSKLTKKDVLYIRDNYKEMGSTKDIALKYGVKPNAILNIINIKTWKHI